MERFPEFFLNHWDLFAALFIILIMMGGGGIMQRMRGFQSVDPSAAVLLMNHENALYLDVRDTNEMSADGKVFDSMHVPLGELGKRISELDSYKDRTVIVGCRSGARSSAACGKLRKAGFEKVYNLVGGIMAWKSAGLPLDKGDKKKRKNK